MEMSGLISIKFSCNSLIRERAAILQLLTSKDQTLLVRGDTVLEGRDFSCDHECYCEAATDPSLS